MITEMENAVDATSKALWWALGVLLLTTVHHVYGAFVYDTPWRNHVAIISTLTATVILGSHYVLRRSTSVAARRIAFWVFAAVTLAIPVVIIGLFEGGYNHVVKDAMYFIGASPNLMRQLFPPPTYEMPNDALFEISGVLQLVPAVITGRYLIAAVLTHVRRSQYAIS